MWAMVGAALAAEPVELSLAEALDRLERDGPDAAQLAARADAARGIARQARAAWLPILAATGSYTHNDEEVVLGFSQFADILPSSIELPPDVTIQPLEVFNGAVSARIPLFAPSAWADSRAAGKSADAADASARAGQLQLETGLVRAAAGAEAARGVVEAAERAVTVADEHLRALVQAQAAGTATPLDVLSAQADLARRKSDLAQARSEVDGLLDQLGALLGVDGPVRVVLPETGPPPAEAIRLPSLDAAVSREEGARAAVAGAWWRLSPTVAATGMAATATTPFATGKDTAWKVGFEATWTLYDGGFRYGRLDQARADLRAATAAREAADLGASREEREALRAVGVATERLALAEEQARLGAKAADVAARGLSAGTVSPLQARDIDADAFRAEVGVVGARAQLRIAEASLRAARGLSQR
jgi:outer membrane protein TolC